MDIQLTKNIQSTCQMLQQVLILDDISKTYNIDRTELFQKYLSHYNDEDVNQNIPKKRGRKKKIKDDFIETEEYEYMGKVYLVDKNNIVYSNDPQKPVVLGKKLPDGGLFIVFDEQEQHSQEAPQEVS
jgi:hypothetical protein